MFFELPTMPVAFAQRVTLLLALKLCTWYSPQVPSFTRPEISLPPPPTHTIPPQPTRTISIEHARPFPSLSLFLGPLGYSILVIFVAVAVTIVLGTFFHICHTTYLMISRVFSGPAGDALTESGLLGPSGNDLARGPLVTSGTPNQDDYHPVSPTNPHSDPTPTLDFVLSNIQDTLYQSTSAPYALIPPDLEDNTMHATNPLNSFDSTSTSRAAPPTTLGAAVSPQVTNTSTLALSSPEGNTSLSSGTYSTEPFTNSETPTLHSSTLSLNAAIILGTTTLDQHLDEATADLENDVAALHRHATPEASDSCEPSSIPKEVNCDNSPTLDPVPTTSIEPTHAEFLISKLQEKVTRRDRKLENLDEEYQKLQEECRELLQQVQQSDAIWMARIAVLLKEFDEFNRVMDYTENLKRAHAKLKKQFAGLEAENANLKTNNANLRDDTTCVERIKDSLARTNDVLRRDISNLRRSNERLIREVTPAYDQALAEGASDEWSAAVVSGAAAFAPPRRFDYPQVQNLYVGGPPPNC
ncbi:hypothetical protein C0995_007509 [Termitomyces sp. Mi166|nr:hypothetical protein C0995_007509 [Termitomyces sp. Mi166\